MNNKEFRDLFDVLYNSITSNQAPGLNDYEKSVFLTKALEDILKSYFDPKTNKTQEGFDGSEKRLIDFSMILTSKTYKETITPINPDTPVVPDTSTLNDAPSIKHMFSDSFFDGRENTKSIKLDENILMIINEYVEVLRGGKSTRLIVLPINYMEYTRLMNKPYKRPLKGQAWRLLDSTDGSRRAEFVIGPNDTITTYVIRYLRRPKPIILGPLDEVTIEGYAGVDSDGNLIKDYSTASEGPYNPCELDPILHEEILLRAVELAKASYTGDLNSLIALGGASQTLIGFVSSGNREQ